MNIDQTLRVIDFMRRSVSGEFTSPSQFARALIGLALDVVDVTELRVHLSSVSLERSERIADAAEIAKLNGLFP